MFDQYISNVNLLQGEGKDVLHRSMNISCRFVSFGIVIPSQNLANIIRPSLPFFPYEFTIVPIIENNPWEQTRGDWIFTTNNLKSIYVSDRRSMDNCYKKVLEGSGLASSIDDESPRLVEDYNHDRSIVSSRKKKALFGHPLIKLLRDSYNTREGYEKKRGRLLFGWAPREAKSRVLFGKHIAKEKFPWNTYGIPARRVLDD